MHIPCSCLTNADVSVSQLYKLIKNLQVNAVSDRSLYTYSKLNLLILVIVIQRCSMLDVQSNNKRDSNFQVIVEYQYLMLCADNAIVEEFSYTLRIQPVEFNCLPPSVVTFFLQVLCIVSYSVGSPSFAGLEVLSNCICHKR